MARASFAASRSSLRNLGAASAIAALVIGGEYLFRHYVLFLLPVIGTLSVNDMLSLFLVYSLLTVGLGALVHTKWRQELAGVARALRDGLTSWGFAAWFFALMLSVVGFSIADRFLWQNINLAMVVSPYRNPTRWFASAAPILEAFSLILVNGLFVPVAEEYLWRGLIQARLTGVLPTPFAIGLTAILFSLKHTLVDASMGRLLTLIAFGVICGIVAQRSSWRHSAALHIAINTVSTVAGLIYSLM